MLWKLQLTLITETETILLLLLATDEFIRVEMCVLVRIWVCLSVVGADLF